MKVLFFTKGNAQVASSRQRVWLVADHLKKEFGYIYTVLSPPWDASRVRKEIRGKCDYLFVHKSLFPWWVIAYIVCARIFLRKKFVYDLDDGEWEHSFAKTRLLVSFASGVFCGSEVIFKWVKQYNKNAALIPTVVDHEIYARHAIPYRERALYTIGWVGSGKGHFLDGAFDIIKPALDGLAAKGFSFRFVVVGAQNYQPLKNYFQNTKYEVIFIDELDWANLESVPQAIEKYQFDVGVMPTADTVFNRAKCAFKAIEYMATGLPVVATPVGENTKVVENGKMGFIVSDKKEWVEALGRLLSNTELRKKIGFEGKTRVAEHFSYQTAIPKYDYFLRLWIHH